MGRGAMGTAYEGMQERSVHMECCDMGAFDVATYGLNDVLDGPSVDAAVDFAPSAAHHARGQRMVKAERVAWDAANDTTSHSVTCVAMTIGQPTNGVHPLANKQV